MATMFQSLLDRTAKLPATLHRLFSRSPGTSSPSSAYSQFVRDLEKLRRRMERIQALLEDAEDREIRERSIRLWLDELRDVAYDCEDVLDEVEYELQWYQLACQEEEHTPSSPEKRGIKRKREVNDSDATPRCPPLHDASFQLQIAAKIKDINDRFEEIHRDGLALKLHEDHGQRHSSDSLSEPPLRMPTSCLVDEQAVRGRDDDKRKVMDMLLSDDGRHCKENVGVVSIVGMGGLGKTTLAQLVYNDVQVKNHFPTRMWVCVSDSFDVVRLTKEILLEALKERSSDQVQGSSNFNYLQESLRMKLQGKRFFLVLDDVWNENQGYWEALWLCLSSGAEGSKVLITTRNEMVSRTSFVSEANMHRMSCLSDQDSWSLFEQRAFSGRNSSDCPELVLIGKKIVQKCKGLPLTVKTLAGLLFCEFSEDRWKDILKSDLWDLAEGKDQILPALKLSYRHLPSPIKLCFVYCAVFPKDHRFNRDQLVKMWMAHGYTRPTATRCMEDVGRGYFDNLLQRSFFQKDFGDYFVMHDLIHDLALSLGKGECCEVVDGKLSNIGRPRHLFLNCWEDVRTFLSCGGPTGELLRLRTCYLRWSLGESRDVLGPLENMFGTMKCLRMLYLGCPGIRELPDSVGNLKHLRYLAINIGGCRCLPESLGNIINLQTLQLFSARHMLELPKSIKYLVNLRHLQISEFYGLQMMPRGIGRLTQLRTLPLFVVGEGSGAAGIEELTGLNDLQGRLKIVVKSYENNDSSRVTEVVGGDQNNGSEVCNYILKNKQGLESLALIFQFGLCDRQEKLIESLQPHTNIKRLGIDVYRGLRFPKWMGDASYSRLEEIYVTDCRYCSCFWQLGQLPSLKRLLLTRVRAERREMAVVEDSSFQSLEELILESFRALEGLSLGTSRCSFPRLRVLSIHKCKSLKYIKLWNLAALKKLIVNDCPKLKRAKLRHLMALRELHIRTCKRLTMVDCSVRLKHCAVDGHIHVPRVHTIRLFGCPKLYSTWALRRLLLAPSLRWLSLEGVYHLTQPLMTQAYQDLSIISHRVGDPLGHLCHLVKVNLSGCLNCRCLPRPLGHLPNLKELHISKMPEVTHVGSDFHGGGGGGIPFRSLQTLELRDMPRWEEWQDVEEEDGAFPNLQLLRICNCPILRPPKLSPRLLLMLESDFSCSDFAEESSNAAHYRDPQRMRIQ